MGIKVESQEEMKETVEKALKSSPEEIQNTYDTHIHGGNVRILLHWIECISRIKITVADADRIGFECVVAINTSIRHHKMAINAFEAAASVFCAEVTEEPETEFESVLSGDIGTNALGDNLYYRMKYDVEREKLLPDPDQDWLDKLRDG